jgi:GT2 family glycosyltransferase
MTRLREVTEDDQRAFCEDARVRWGRAAAASGEVGRTYEIAGTVVRLRFAGEALLPYLTPALAHLRAASDARADLDVLLWDTRTTGVAMAPPPCPERSFTERGNVWGLENERVRFGFQWGEFSVSLFDVASSTALFWVADAARLPFWTHAAPLRGLLSWWLAHRGMQLVHGAVVGTDDGAVLVTARGGSGKSTLALACLRGGLSYVGDDYVAVALDPEPRAYSLYCTAKLEPRQLERVDAFRALAAEARVGRDGRYEKAVLFLGSELTAGLRVELPLTAVLVPAVTGEAETTLAPIEAQAVERAAALTTISQLPHSGQRTVDFMTRLARGLPRAALRLGTDYARIPDVIRDCARGGAAFRDVARTGRDPGGGRDDLPFVSVVIPVHDGAGFVREAVESVLAQSYPRLEILIVDDASRDGTREAVERLGVELRYFEYETNQGPAEARNRGLREAAADYVAFLDVDDLWPPGRLERMVSLLLDDPSIDVVTGRAQVFERDAATGAYREAGDPRTSFPFYVGAGVYRRRAFLRNGPFDRAFRFGEDADWFLRAFETGLRCVQLDEVTLHVRRHAGNMTRGKTNVEMNHARVFKARLDRRRARERGAG